MTDRIVAFDSGAKRAGYALLHNDVYVASAVFHFPREVKEAYQDYRMRLTGYWAWKTEKLIEQERPTVIVTEMVPVYGMNDFSQGYLANVMATTVHAIAIQKKISVVQVSAVKVQNAIAKRGKTKKITKPQVRNGVLELYPQLSSLFKGEPKIFERSDAIAIAAWYFKTFSSKK